jgi:hypothetical protein
LQTTLPRGDRRTWSTVHTSLPQSAQTTTQILISPDRQEANLTAPLIPALLLVPKDQSNTRLKYDQSTAKQKFLVRNSSGVQAGLSAISVFRSLGTKAGLLLGLSPGYQSGRLVSPWGVFLEKVANHICPRCGWSEMNVYYSDRADSRVGAWCEHCDMRGYYHGEELVPISW